MGAIADRSWEHLSVSDWMIVITRRRLLAAARALAETGVLPPGAANAAAYGRVRGGFFLAPQERAWPDVYHRQLAAVRNANTTEAAE
jgi:phthalate 4,5-dioxygenase